eukprot:12522912-Alexandrium_andersonii.AAC.1
MRVLRASSAVRARVLRALWVALRPALVCVAGRALVVCVRASPQAALRPVRVCVCVRLLCVFCARVSSRQHCAS